VLDQVGFRVDFRADEGAHAVFVLATQILIRHAMEVAAEGDIQELIATGIIEPFDVWTNDLQSHAIDCTI